MLPQFVVSDELGTTPRPLALLVRARVVQSSMSDPSIPAPEGHITSRPIAVQIPLRLLVYLHVHIEYVVVDEQLVTSGPTALELFLAGVSLHMNGQVLDVLGLEVTADPIARMHVLVRPVHRCLVFVSVLL